MMQLLLRLIRFLYKFMADVTNQTKQDSPLEVVEPTAKSPSEQTYIDTGGKIESTATGRALVYASITPVSASNVGSADLATFTIPAGTLVKNNVLRVRCVFSDTDWDAAGSVILSLNIGPAVGFFSIFAAIPGLGLTTGGAGLLNGEAEFVIRAVDNKNQEYNNKAFFSKSGQNSAALVQSVVAPTVAVSTSQLDGTVDQPAVLKITWTAPSATNAMTLAWIVADKLTS